MADVHPRAQRFPVATPVRYRSLTTSDWNAGITVNISRSGVLFAGETPMRPGMAIEMWLTMPSSAVATEDSQVLAYGFVVRAEAGAQPPQMAAEFRQQHAPILPGTEA